MLKRKRNRLIRSAFVCLLAAMLLLMPYDVSWSVWLEEQEAQLSAA